MTTRKKKRPTPKITRQRRKRTTRLPPATTALVLAGVRAALDEVLAACRDDLVQENIELINAYVQEGV